MKKTFIIVVLIFTFVVSGIYAASNFQSIDVMFDSINIKVNGEEVDSTNILYKGTTYVPLRAVSEMLQKKVGWDESTMTASIDDANEVDKKQENQIATITMQNDEIIRIELYPNEAPKTVENFIELAEKGFYNGLTFHRIVPGFVIQGGDPNGDGTGGPGYNIKGEFTQNGVKNTIMHTRGVISMARSSHPDSAGSQFFIVLENAHHLNGEYAAFGKVIEGMDVVDSIVKMEANETETSAESKVMKSITIE